MDAIGQFTAVAGVLGLLLACLWWLRRRGVAPGVVRRRGGRRLEILERLPLGPQHSLHLVRVGGATLLVASSPSGCTLMERLPASEISGPEALR